MRSRRYRSEKLNEQKCPPLCLATSDFTPKAELSDMVLRASWTNLYFVRLMTMICGTSPRRKMLNILGDVLDIENVQVTKNV